LELEAGGKVLVEETDSPTTVLVSSVKFLGTNRETVKKFVEAHRALTDWIQKNPAEAQKLVVAELAAETQAKMAAELIDHTWKRTVLTNEIRRDVLEKFVANAKAAGFLRDVPDLARLIESL
jgi:sulfonate transport system substrate-binding protein